MRYSSWRFLSLALLLPLCMLAQIGGGSIVGYVTDPSGAPIAGAKLTVRDLQTNAEQHAVANETGYYEFPSLSAGRYRLEAEAAGFSKAVGGEFELHAGTRPRIDLALRIGAVTESVV